MGGDSRRSAPTHPSYMPGATRQVSTLAPQRAQIQPQRGERAQIKRNETKRDGNSRPAPPRPFNMPREKHASTWAPLSAPKPNAWERELKYCSRAPHPSKIPTDPPRQHFSPAERAHTKRTGGTGGNSRPTAPTHPLHMPHSKTPRQYLAPADTPSKHLAPLMRGEREWVQQLLTRRLALGMLDG